MTGRKKIVILLPGLGCVERGAENATLELSKRLARDFDLVIFCQGNPTGLKGIKNITIVKIPALSRDSRLTNFLYCRLPARLRTLLSIFQLDPVGLEMFTFTLMVAPILLLKKFDIAWPINGLWGAAFCRFLRFWRGTPFIYTSHGGEEPLVARQNPDIYIALTRFTANWLKSYDNSLQVEYIPNGVDIKKFKSQSASWRTKVKVGLQRPIFVCVGALISQKRIDLAIKAVSKLKSGSLLVLGAGPLKCELKDLGEKLLGKERFMIKSVSYEEVPRYLNSADAFTLPSQDDPAPLVYLEAAAVNLPIVAPDEKRRRMELLDFASYCDVRDAESYAKTLVRAVGSKVKTREWALSHSWDKIAQEYMKLLHNFMRASITS